MDEYRPYPPDQPAEEEEEEEEEGIEADETAAAVTGATGNVVASTITLDEAPAGDAEDDERRQGQRAEPDLDHPGGHLSGTVARLNRPRRFGFLRAEDGAEVFFHASALETGPSSFDALRPGQPVEFDCHQDEHGRGLAATLVQVVGPPPERPAQARPAREERRTARGGRARAEAWRVEVLQERLDNPVHDQLERLLNERGVKPGHVTLSLLDRAEGIECWVVYHIGEDTGGRK